MIDEGQVGCSVLVFPLDQKSRLLEDSNPTTDVSNFPTLKPYFPREKLSSQREPYSLICDYALILTSFLNARLSCRHHKKRTAKVEEQHSKWRMPMFVPVLVSEVETRIGIVEEEFLAPFRCICGGPASSLLS
jgi:hypothetical protein